MDSKNNNKTHLIPASLVSLVEVISLESISPSLKEVISRFLLALHSTTDGIHEFPKTSLRSSSRHSIFRILRHSTSLYFSNSSLYFRILRHSIFAFCVTLFSHSASLNYGITLFSNSASLYFSHSASLRCWRSLRESVLQCGFDGD